MDRLGKHRKLENKSISSILCIELILCNNRFNHLWIRRFTEYFLRKKSDYFIKYTINSKLCERKQSVLYSLLLH
ncbi:unnamed protein product [Schistosoma turkestanicum]|nr:unnamed protein product [Schistosoma turkestanicum]